MGKSSSFHFRMTVDVVVDVVVLVSRAGLNLVIEILFLDVTDTKRSGSMKKRDYDSLLPHFHLSLLPLLLLSLLLFFSPILHFRLLRLRLLLLPYSSYESMYVPSPPSWAKDYRRSAICFHSRRIR